MRNPKTKDIDYECLLEFREEVIVDHSEQSFKEDFERQVEYL